MLGVPFQRACIRLGRRQGKARSRLFRHITRAFHSRCTERVSFIFCLLIRFVYRQEPETELKEAISSICGRMSGGTRPGPASWKTVLIYVRNI